MGLKQKKIKNKKSNSIYSKFDKKKALNRVKCSTFSKLQLCGEPKKKTVSWTVPCKTRWSDVSSSYNATKIYGIQQEKSEMACMHATLVALF